MVRVHRLAPMALLVVLMLGMVYPGGAEGPSFSVSEWRSPEKEDDGVYHMGRPHYEVMAGSHRRYERSGDVDDKVPASGREYAHLMRGEGPISIAVYTHGEPHTSHHPAGEFHGYRVTEAERATLAGIGVIEWESGIYPSIRLSATGWGDVQRVAAMREVYAIMPPIPLDRPWLRPMQS